MSRRTRKEGGGTPSGTSKDSHGRGFLRQATLAGAALAGAALAAGAGGLSVSGCCKGKEAQVAIRADTLVVLDDDLSIALTRIWNEQRAADLPEATTRSMGITVKFDSLGWSGDDAPEPEKIVSLCRC